MSSTAFKTMRFHGRAVRSVAFHATHPLMASASDDGTIQVFHTRVYKCAPCCCRPPPPPPPLTMPCIAPQ